MKVKDSRDDLSQCGCDTCVMKTRHLTSCRRSHLRSHVFVNCCIRRYSLYTPVGDSRLLSAVTDIITINCASNSC